MCFLNIFLHNKFKGVPTLLFSYVYSFNIFLFHRSEWYLALKSRKVSV